jgi:hypothetical protein
MGLPTKGIIGPQFEDGAAVFPFAEPRHRTLEAQA